MASSEPAAAPVLAAAPSIRVRSARDLGALPAVDEDSAQAVKRALEVLKSSDSTWKDKLTALRIVLFLSFEDPRSSKFAWWLSIFLFLAIILNCMAFIVGSIKSTQVIPKSCPKPACVPGPDAPCTEVICAPIENPKLFHIELWTIVIFTIDYLIRMLTVSAVPASLVFPRSLSFAVDGTIKDRSAREELNTTDKTLKYIFSWLNLVDLVSILPFIIAVSLANGSVLVDLGVLRIMRLFRVMRVLKLGKYYEGGLIIGRSIRASLPALILFVFLISIIITTFGSLMYFFEGGMFQVTQEFPAGGFLRENARGTAKEESPFTSILTGMYWVVINTTTLGNAALFPTTTLGRVCSVFVAYIGILALALPISIVGKNFTEQYNMVYDKTGGQYEAPMHHQLQQQQQQQQEAAAAAKLAPGSTTVVTAKRVESEGEGEGEEREMGRMVRELQARLLRMEAEMASLRSQVRAQQGGGEGAAGAGTEGLLQPTIAGVSQEQ